MIKSRLAKICLSYAVAFATSTGVLLADTSLSTMTCNDIFAIKQYQSQHFLRELAFSPGYVDGFLPETMEVKGDRSAFRALVKLFVQKTKHLYHGVEKQKVSDRVTDSAQVFLPGQWHTVLVLKDSMRVIEKYNFLTTKHLALAKSGEAVRFAGEIFLDGDGTIYLSNDSGTFQPTVAQLHAMTAMMREIFPKAKIVEVPYLEQGAFEKSVATSIAKETVGQEYNLFDANIDMQLASKLDGQKISGMRILRYALKKSTSYVTEKKDRPDIVAVTEKEYKITGEMPLDLNQLTLCW